MRLEQVLFSQGFGTRHECRGLILLGRVTFDGQLMDDPDIEVDPVGCVFTVDGIEWPYFEKGIVALHKPAGYECSQKPTHHTSVMTLLPAPLRVRGLQPVGRLDEDTTGLLILTDDGALHHRLIHPKRHVEKVYEVTCKHPVDDTICGKLLAGVQLVDERELVRASACHVTGTNTLSLSITTGKYHQVKRMLAAAGNRVEALHRSAFGAFSLPAGLAEGRWMWIPDRKAILG